VLPSLRPIQRSTQTAGCLSAIGEASALSSIVVVSNALTQQRREQPAYAAIILQTTTAHIRLGGMILVGVARPGRAVDHQSS